MERSIQRTDDDAAASKYSAVIKGYYEDEYISLFCPRQPQPRLPLINIGTYCRHYGIERVVAEFLERTKDDKERAIVSLGAGSDTRPFHLLPRHPRLLYHEIDFPVKTKRKVQIIQDNPKLREAVGATYMIDSVALGLIEAYREDLHSERYHIYGADLRQFSSDPPQIPDALRELGEKKIPTLVLSECCLCYLAPEQSDGVLKFFADLIPKPLLSVAIYEPISLNDEFGRVMTENLAMRGLALPTVNRYPTLESQVNRLKSLTGAPVAYADDMATVYNDWIDDAERARISQLELLDEIEEMILLMRHYTIAATAVNAPA